MTPVLSKEEFVNYMNFIDKQNTYECKINNLMREVYTDVIFFPNLQYEETFVSLLKIVMDDKHSDIDYFIYELDFGRKWQEGSVTVDDVDIKLATPEDLYDYLLTKLVDKTE